MSRGRNVMKRLMDVLLSVMALVLLAPVMLAVAIAVRLTLGSPVLFRQARPGLHGTPFGLMKFRSMTDARDNVGDLLPDSQRLPVFGQFLRRTSLDELPELFNVIRGQMSLVGPRPLLVEYLPLYTPQQARRHEVRPGLTGWAQINGRNTITWVDKFTYDVWYVDHRSLRLDIYIMWRTLSLAARGTGVSGEGSTTVLPFRGSI